MFAYYISPHFQVFFLSHSEIITGYPQIVYQAQPYFSGSPSKDSYTIWSLSKVSELGLWHRLETYVATGTRDHATSSLQVVSLSFLLSEDLLFIKVSQDIGHVTCLWYQLQRSFCRFILCCFAVLSGEIPLQLFYFYVTLFFLLLQLLIFSAPKRESWKCWTYT